MNVTRVTKNIHTSYEEVEVISVVNGSLWVDRFYADEVLAAQLAADGEVLIQLVNGRDAKGPVLSAQYANGQRIIRRRLSEDDL